MWQVAKPAGSDASAVGCAVVTAGYDAGEGFIKLPYDRELPTDLLMALMRARVEEYEITGAD